MSFAPAAALPAAKEPTLRGLVPFAVAIPLLALLQILVPEGSYFLKISYDVGVAIVLAVSLNIVNGFTGQFSLGHAGFMAVGGYTAAVVTLALRDSALSPALGQLLFFAALLIGGAAAALAGLLVGLPSLRLKGDYLAIVTLGFGEIIRVVVENTELFGKSTGLTNIPPYAGLFSIYFWVFLTVLVARRLVGSSHGRALLAIREDEVAAEAMGVDTTGYKVRAFVVSSFFAGVAGGLFGHYLTNLGPKSFTFVKSIEVVTMVVLGGLGSISGSILSAIVLTVLPELLRGLDEYRMVLYAVLLVVLMEVRPAGLFGPRELWELLPALRTKGRKLS